MRRRLQRRLWYPLLYLRLPYSLRSRLPPLLLLLLPQPPFPSHLSLRPLSLPLQSPPLLQFHPSPLKFVDDCSRLLSDVIYLE